MAIFVPGCCTPACCFYFLCVTFQPTVLSSVLTLLSFISSSILLPYSGYQLLFFLGRVPIKSLDLASFSKLSNMTQDDLTTAVAVAATTQVKLCPFNEEDPHIWFRLIRAQFAVAGIRSKKFKYANALASLPKQVLWDILDMLDVCNESDEPFDYLKTTLLGQFRKSKCQSYFELLCLPMEMQGLTHSVLMGN